MTFGDRLREILEQKEIMQKKFAARLNISESAISDYVNDRRLPNILLVNDMAKELGVSVDYLLGYQPAPESVAVSPREVGLIQKFRALPKEKQDIMISLMEMLSEN